MITTYASQFQALAAQAGSKHQYQAPALRHFGSVAELTQASSGPCAFDGTQGFCIMLNMAMLG